MIHFPRPGFIVAPDGSSATFDRDATIAAYRVIEDSDCRCEGCANFRLAFDPSLLDTGIADACAAIGIDMTKPRETSRIHYNEENRLQYYMADFVFVGDLEALGRVSEDFWWTFGRGTRSYSDEFTQRHAAIELQIGLPWVLDGPPSDTRCSVEPT